LTIGAVPEQVACPPGLVYVSDEMPGIRRVRRGRGFSYLDPSGRPLRDPAERARIAALGVPPAYREVWICPLPAGHLQATGLDVAGRKQYRYHPDWTNWRSRTKYDSLAEFGAALPRFRARIRRDLDREAGERAFALAAVSLLLDRLHLRVGSAGHTAVSRTYGATTLLTRHVKLQSGTVRLRYRAKGGRTVEHRLADRKLHRIFEAIGDLPGRNLFTWIGDDGEPHALGSQHVNDYIAEATGLGTATAKTFRTWAGSVAALTAAHGERGRLTVRVMAEAAAARLHNTPAISRTSYIHPAVLDLATLPPAERLDLLRGLAPVGPGRLRAEERRLLGLLAAGAAADRAA
jgi:DNA topoisomerase I